MEKNKRNIYVHITFVIWKKILLTINTMRGKKYQCPQPNRNIGKIRTTYLFCKNTSSHTPIGKYCVERAGASSEEVVSGRAVATGVMTGRPAWIPGHPDL